jgi:hypothetical protein
MKNLNVNELKNCFGGLPPNQTAADHQQIFYLSLDKTYGVNLPICTFQNVVTLKDQTVINQAKNFTPDPTVVDAFVNYANTGFSGNIDAALASLSNCDNQRTIFETLITPRPAK